MIRISVDEALAYDMLAILGVKSWNTQSAAVEEARIALASEIARQVPNHEEICASNEWADLFQTNEAIFNRINWLKTRGEHVGDAVEIDRLNYQRFLQKQALQKRFFPDKRLVEVKVGYS